MTTHPVPQATWPWQPEPRQRPAEPIEIKANVLGDVETALSLLRLGHGSPRKIWFMEDSHGHTPHPLLTAGLTLRLRTDDDGHGESTVKLRPCHRWQLQGKWTRERKGDDWGYKIEADWTGTRRVLAASCTAERSKADVAAALATGADPWTLFIGHQHRFFRACGPRGADSRALRPLGPIKATQWKKNDLNGFCMNAERWQVGSHDFLELSIRVDPEEPQPEKAQRDFEAAVRSHGVRITEAASRGRHVCSDDTTKSKTELVLDLLAGHIGRSGTGP